MHLELMDECTLWIESILIFLVDCKVNSKEIECYLSHTKIS